MEYVLKTDKLSKRYRKFKALDGVDLSVPKGSVYGLVGRNGAGKTTLMRVICGLQPKSGGGYEFFGIKDSDNALGRCRRRLGAIIEKPALYLNLSARKNLEMQYSLLGMPNNDSIDELLELVGLPDLKSSRGKNGWKHSGFAYGRSSVDRDDPISY